MLLAVNVSVQLAVIPAQICPFPSADATIIGFIPDRLPAELNLLSVEPGGFCPGKVTVGNPMVYALIFIPQAVPVLRTCVVRAGATNDYCNYY